MKKIFNLRLANISDAKVTFDWVNDPNIRQYSFSKERIDWDSHIKWFEKKIYSPECLYYILEENNYAVGSIRFDINEKFGVVSYLIAPIFQGRGLGKLILEYGIEKLRKAKPKLVIIEGVVFKNNIASIRIFNKLGFEIESEDDISFKFKKNLNAYC